ncbi:MAG: methyltransferase domain-containing protein [Chitinispirillaceae bacterium]|nr:methyltransferase domain-containing protein [Chitinispirillaceae bacterium]
MVFTRDYWMPDLSFRTVSAELMDDTAADENLLVTTLCDFKYINRFISQIRRVLHATVIADMQRRNAHEVSFLDIAAGGCDIGLWFARYCRSRGITCSVYCLDNDPRALKYAREACRDEPSISFIETDARDIGGLGLSVDYAFTNHFLHHLSDEYIPGILRAIGNCSRHGFVVHDLERAYWSYVCFTLLAGILYRGGFTFTDGRISIRRGFTLAELRRYVTSAGIDATITRSGLGHWRITNIKP